MVAVTLPWVESHSNSLRSPVVHSYKSHHQLSEHPQPLLLHQIDGEMEEKSMASSRQKQPSLSCWEFDVTLTYSFSTMGNWKQSLNKLAERSPSSRYSDRFQSAVLFVRNQFCLFKNTEENQWSSWVGWVSSKWWFAFKQRKLCRWPRE